jgi:hypothetical protein
MPKFKVIGVKDINYYTTVEAKDSYEAFDKAYGLNTNEWSELETDDVIEPFDVTEIDDDAFPEFDQINVVGADA